MKSSIGKAVEDRRLLLSPINVDKLLYLNYFL
jgi:hypothetical protein